MTLSRPFAILAILSLSLAFAATALARAGIEWSYSMTNCGCDENGCDTWEWDIHCKVTAGASAAGDFSLETAVAISEAAGIPVEVTVLVRDAEGNPVRLPDGTVLAFEEAPDVAAAVEDQRGRVSPGHRWIGFRSVQRLPMPTEPGAATQTYRLLYEFDELVEPVGAGWFGDDADERLGARSVEALAVFGALDFGPQGGCLSSRVEEQCRDLSGLERRACRDAQSLLCRNQNFGPDLDDQSAARLELEGTLLVHCCSGATGRELLLAEVEIDGSRLLLPVSGGEGLLRSGAVADGDVVDLRLVSDGRKHRHHGHVTILK